MAENNQPKTKVSGQERFHLDTYGFAQLGKENTSMQVAAMNEMYGVFLEEGDPIISRTLNEASKARNHLAQERLYESVPEEERDESQNPGTMNEYLRESLETVNHATLMYAEKRDDMYGDLTTRQALDYHSRKDGKLTVETPDNVVTLIKERSGAVKDLGEDGKDGLARTSLKVIDNYNIHGNINSRVQKGIAKRNLERISSGLEAMSEDQS